MKFELSLFRVDVSANGEEITHRAGYEPGDGTTPETWKWYPVAKSDLPHELESARQAMKFFNCVNWNIPERTGAPIAYGNVRQIFNPHGSGAGGCAQAGIVVAFIQWALEYPRVQTYVKGMPVGLYIGGVEYIDADKPKPKPGKNKTAIDEALEEYEYSTGGFYTQCKAFKQYVDWVGANAGCVHAAQRVILTFDKLVDALGECGIDRVGELPKAYTSVENALEEMCLALADAETAAQKANEDGKKIEDANALLHQSIAAANANAKRERADNERLQGIVADGTRAGVAKGVTDAAAKLQLRPEVIVQPGASVTVETRRNAKIKKSTSHPHRPRAKGCTDDRIAAQFSQHAMPLMFGKKNGRIIYEAKIRGTTTNKANACCVGTVSPKTIRSWLQKWDCNGTPEPKSGFTGDMLTDWNKIKAAAKAWGEYWQRYATAFCKWRQTHPHSRRSDFRYKEIETVHGAETQASVDPDVDDID